MNENEIDRLIDEAFRREAELPRGLTDRLEKHIDRLAADEKKRMAATRRRRSLYLLGGMAATLLLAAALFFPTPTTTITPTMADTFSDPAEADLVARDALAHLSAQFNKGLEQASEAGKEVERIQEIVHNQFEVLGADSKPKP